MWAPNHCDQTDGDTRVKENTPPLRATANLGRCRDRAVRCTTER